MSDQLKYSIETLVHFVCRCGRTWAISGELPEFITCPKCRIEYIKFVDVTPKINHCSLHQIWYYADICPMEHK